MGLILKGVMKQCWQETVSNCRLGSVIHYSWEYQEEGKLTQKCSSYLHLDKPFSDANPALSPSWQG